MTLTRRATLAMLAAMTAPAMAQAQPSPEPWPSRPVRIIVPAPGGAGTADTLARIFAQEMEKRLTQRVLVENRGGANGNIGAVAGARAAPDGYTILWSWAGTLATNPALYRSLPFDPVRDFEPVVLIGNVPNLLVVNRQLGPTTLDQFTAFARANHRPAGGFAQHQRSRTERDHHHKEDRGRAQRVHRAHGRCEQRHARRSRLHR